MCFYYETLQLLAIKLEIRTYVWLEVVWGGFPGDILFQLRNNEFSMLLLVRNNAFITQQTLIITTSY
jgi:hypothetical protein